MGNPISDMCVVVTPRMTNGYRKMGRVKQHGSLRNSRASSSHGPITPTRVDCESWKVGHRFHESYLEEKKKEVEEVEVVVQTQRYKTYDKKIL
jgi:hypothetical protein